MFPRFLAPEVIDGPCVRELDDPCLRVTPGVRDGRAGTRRRRGRVGWRHPHVTGSVDARMSVEMMHVISGRGRAAVSML